MNSIKRYMESALHKRDINLMMKNSGDSYLDMILADIRQKIQMEYAFDSLVDHEKENIRYLLLHKFEFKKDIPMRENRWDARAIYHLNHKNMSKNFHVLSLFRTMVKVGREFESHTDKWLKLMKVSLESMTSNKNRWIQY